VVEGEEGDPLPQLLGAASEGKGDVVRELIESGK